MINNIFTMFLTKLDPTVAFSIGKIEIKWYAIIIMLGAISGTLFGYYRFGKRMGINSDIVFTGLVYGLVFGILGARLYYVIFTASTGEIKYNSFLEVINPKHGGLAIHGGIIAAAIFLPIYSKIKHIKLIHLLEIAMPLILFAQVVGRWGNFINKEAFGGLVEVEGLEEALKSITSRAQVLPEGILEAQKVALRKLLVPNFVINNMFIDYSSASGYVCQGYYYPTFYFESCMNLIGIIIYMLARKYIKQIKVGDGISFYLIWYGIVRWIIESMRTDPLILGNTKIKMAILTSIIYIILGITFLIVKRLVKKFDQTSCKEALYGENASLMEEGYFNEPEPFFITAIINKFKKNDNNKVDSEENE